MKHKFTIGTFNIRYGLADDGINIWDNRKGLVIDSITEKLPDIIGFQEALPFVKDYLEENLLQYIILGSGRDQDLQGEYNCIAIRRDSFEPVFLETLWLSHSPYVPGTKLDNSDSFPRICTTVILRSKINNQLVRVINTHLDYRFADIRLQQLEILNNILKQYEGKVSMPTLLTGDLNCTPDSKEIDYVLNDFCTELKDISTEQNINSNITFHDYYRNSDYKVKIDYIFATHDFELVKSYIDDTVKEGVYLSDHYPIYAVVEI